KDMKKCPYCGKEYPDDATLCEIDSTELVEQKPIQEIPKAKVEEKNLNSPPPASSPVATGTSNGNQKRDLIEEVTDTAWIAYKLGSKRWDELDKERENMRRGATGEILVGQMLTDFPDDFRVINGLSTPFGDLDHVVVGPTGIFVLDSK